MAITEYPPEFLDVVKRVLEDEGGYVNRPDDPGGETKFGISKREYPELDIAALSVADAIEIYFQDWWQRFGFGLLPAAIGAKCFDLAVNIGVKEAVICLQRAFRALGYRTAEDGAIGPMTTDICGTLAMHRQEAELMAAFKSELAGHYRTLAAAENGKSDQFLRGWLNRAYR